MPGMGHAEIMAAACCDELVRGYADPGVAVAVAAVDKHDGTATACSKGCPEDARFEIGSLTKTLTATLLAGLVNEGTVHLDDAVERWIPAGAGSGITFRHLATHTSGLPRLGGNNMILALLTPANPYVHYTPARAERALHRFAHTAQRGPERSREHGYAYSNFGYQLLGLALERASGRTYRQLLEDIVLGPLAMKNTGAGHQGGGTRIPGHARGRRTSHWDQPLPGAGGVESTIDDLARYLDACLAAASSTSTAPTAVLQAIELAQTPLVPIDQNREIGLAWIRRADGTLWHNGRTGGFSASLAVNAASGRALAVLVSTASGPMDALDGLVVRTVAGAEPDFSHLH